PGYRGRPDGRYALSGRGRKRSRGPSGGGTLCSGAPQLLQESARAASTRSQWPRAWHCGLMHCTVQPGKYCTVPPRRSRLESREKSAGF
ncbi:MAG: hypothetical protein WAR21_08820, partial [Candidatus Acidiferrales bacterium]